MTQFNLSQSYVGFLYPQTNNESYRTDILTQIISRLDWMISRHNKVLLIRFDVRFPSGYVHNGNNVEISNLLRRLRENLEWNDIEVQYAWVVKRIEDLTPWTK